MKAARLTCVLGTCLCLYGLAGGQEDVAVPAVTPEVTEPAPPEPAPPVVVETKPDPKPEPNVEPEKSEPTGHYERRWVSRGIFGRRGYYQNVWVSGAPSGNRTLSVQEQERLPRGTPCRRGIFGNR